MLHPPTKFEPPWTYHFRQKTKKLVKELELVKELVS